MAKKKPTRVFLSHNSKDKPAVELIGRLLEDRGFDVWLDKWSLAPGSDWQEHLETIIETCEVALVFAGPQGMGRWQDREIKGCLQEFIDRELKVIPILLPGREDPPKLPLFLRSFTWLDYRVGLDDEEALQNLVWGITGEKNHRTPKEASAKNKLASPQSLTFLHLSDIQFGRNNRYRGDDPDKAYAEFYERLDVDLDTLSEQQGLQPDALVLTGDVAEWSLKAEYEQAAKFLEKLL
ncbi:MAG: TIR domain-containing protein, partial [Planctomycetota bacterium]|nr:TIR domain-containing protein [Planctomycetota bacterium]